MKESIIAKLTGGLTGLAKQRKVQVVRGVAKFSSPNSLAYKQPMAKRLSRSIMPLSQRAPAWRVFPAFPMTILA
ncbi:MAG: hypothetical protein WDM70_00215 [Nitrosomonadales bacterium]